MKAEFTKQVRMVQNTFEKYLNVMEHFWNVSKINFWNVFKTNLRYFITLWNVFKQTKSFGTLWKIEQFGHTAKQLRMFSEQILMFRNELKVSNILKIGQSTKQVRMFRNTSKNILMFWNTFVMFPKQILILRNKLKVSKHSENRSNQ